MIGTRWDERYSFDGILLNMLRFLLLITVIVTGLVNAIPGYSQSQASSADIVEPAFEVASIRRSDPESMSHRVWMEFKQDGYSATQVTLKLLLGTIYGVDEAQISGAPAWTNSDEYNIEARIDSNTSDELVKLSGDQRKLVQQHMLQALLADRFKLTLHRETRDLPIYSLIIAKSGSKLHEANAEETDANGVKDFRDAPMKSHFVDYRFVGGDVNIKGQQASWDLLVNRLTQKSTALHLGRKIVDNTGLKGNYNFDLHFKVAWTGGQVSMLEGVDGGNQGTESGVTTDSSELSLFTAFQEQLGLKLEPTRGPVEIIVIDHIERPSDN
jgi:uncharacterized protein (TIGR03435 family)